MSKQISVKSINVNNGTITQMYKETQTYLENIGFRRTNLLSITEKDTKKRVFMYSQGKEKVLIEYNKDKYEEILKAVFEPMEIKFVYEILLMRFNQLARKKSDSVFVYNN